ncbi:UMUC domain protein DNA-repair protein [Limosilactobacillus fermentum CECT 5716]|nr:UMUC domain protein DNA-repair protein [Limosilactobacillus fermentum CECT 5716]
MAQEHTYIAIDLKSFYASAECAAHGLDPLNANLVVADASRTDKTICLAVSPALKSFGVPGRPRLFEVNQQVDRVNRQRAAKFANRRLAKTRSIYKDELESRTGLRVDFMIVPPRMRYYLQVSAKIYEIYLRFIPPEKIHVYSIDEVFIDATDYLATHHESAHALAKKMIQAIQAEFGITATAGIGTNLYLAKVAMDIVAKKIPGDADGVRIVAMTEQDYRRLLWAHQPLTDFWRIGRGYARRLEKLGLHTMGDIARCSLGTLSDPQNEEVLYREFGKHAQLLINHAWGYEAATIEDIKNYRASEHGIYSGQVLMKPYTIPPSPPGDQRDERRPVLAAGQAPRFDQPDRPAPLLRRKEHLLRQQLPRPDRNRLLRPPGSQARSRRCQLTRPHLFAPGAAGRLFGPLRPHRQPGPLNP